MIAVDRPQKEWQQKTNTNILLSGVCAELGSVTHEDEL